MKQTRLILAIIAGLFMTASCSKNGVTINVHDPQHIIFIQGMDENGHVLIDQDLVDAFGEENIHFGHTPPSLEGLSFKVTGMDYDTCIRYIFNANDPSAPPILSHTDPPTYDPSRNFHHFFHHIENISSHKLKTVDSYNDIYVRSNDTVYVIGNEESHCFTAYYEEVIQEEGSGHPTNGILFSATLVYDGEGRISGVKDYRFGKKILKYREHPTTPSYAQGTIEIKTHSGLSPVEEWDQ